MATATLPPDAVAVSATPVRCPHCGAPTRPGQRFCADCGTALLELRSTAGDAEPTDDDYDPVEEADELESGRPPGSARVEAPRSSTAAVEAPRTMTGLLLMILGFGFLWIPYASVVGGLLAFVGVVFLWVGRREFDPAHRRNAVLGGVLVVLGLLVALLAGLSFSGAVIDAATTSGATPQSVGAAFRADLVGVVVAAGVASALTVLGYVLLPYRLADRPSRGLLWAGFASSVGLTMLVAAILLPQVSAAITAATSGSSINPGPVEALEGRATLLGALQILPDLMFLVAYYRTRTALLTDTVGPGRGVAPVSPYGRTG